MEALRRMGLNLRPGIFQIYDDHLRCKTCGIGHLIVEGHYLSRSNKTGKSARL